MLIKHSCPEWDFLEIIAKDIEFEVCLCDCILARKVERIGVQELFRKDMKYFVSIKNRTYFSKVEIPEEKVKIWIDLLK